MAKRAILVAEDDPVLREMLVLILSQAGYEVATGVDGKEAMKLFGQHRFDLVLTDLLMPEKDGTEVIMELRKNHPRIPVVAMSGGGLMPRGEYLKIARMFGAHAIIQKPFTKDELLATIDRLLPE